MNLIVVERLFFMVKNISIKNLLNIVLHSGNLGARFLFVFFWLNI